MVRRLAAKDDSMDILGMDVTWTQEFASAKWIREFTGADETEVENGTLPGPLASAQYQGKLYVAPNNTNVQLLWYRKDLVPDPPQRRRRRTSPRTWPGRATRRSTRARRASLEDLAADAGGADVPPQDSLVTRFSAESRVRDGVDAKVSLNLDKIHLFDPRDGRNITLGD
jgi:ABC-type glycerol-3-phosphate transport system substrate-binding protein